MIISYLFFFLTIKDFGNIFITIKQCNFPLPRFDLKFPEEQ